MPASTAGPDPRERPPHILDLGLPLAPEVTDVYGPEGADDEGQSGNEPDED